MMMGGLNLSNALALNGLCLLCFALLISATIDTSCPGPTKHYEAIGCTPVFKTPQSKCPEKYDCNNLKDLPVDKCFVNGHTYAIGESLREEDKDPCDVGCVCSQNSRGPEFTCAIVDCFTVPHPGCYMKRNATSCCGGQQICPKKAADRPTCIVDGKTYRDGEYFVPAAEPKKVCFCGEGYTGENVEPFCAVRKSDPCRTLLRGINEVRENCAPIYHYIDSPPTGCPISYRCQNARDAVISGSSKAVVTDSDKQCKLGNLTMNVGDELNQGSNYDSVCVKCVCEVGPIPTCQRVPYSQCVVTKSPKF